MGQGDRFTVLFYNFKADETTLLALPEHKENRHEIQRLVMAWEKSRHFRARFSSADEMLRELKG